ncbi:MAG: hypothetical protein HYX75_13175, partial [Acidobacteria bacterium]|nr:hypothetical protein [Acidobacteriota bacterium]
VGAAYLAAHEYFGFNTWHGLPANGNVIGLHGTKPRIERVTIDVPTNDPHDFIDPQSGVLLSYGLDQSADVTLELLSLSRGAVIDTWNLPGQAAGAQEFLWQQTTNDGLRVAPGDYQWRITATANGHTSRAVTILMRLMY